LIAGSPYIGDNRIDAASLSNMFSKCTEELQFISIIRNLNGFFSIIYIRDDISIVAVDRVRSIPIFYYINEDCILLTDRPHCILEKNNEEISELSALEFLLTGYVTGNNTLYPNIRQVQAGEVLFWSKKENSVGIKSITYFRYVPGDYQDCTYDEMLFRFEEVLESIFRRLIDNANGRTIILPLSGGFDSRLIALMLHRLHYKNVLAYSYGKRGNEESKISEEVAQSLDIPWEFTPYSNDDWSKWYKSKEYKDYTQYAFGLSSVPVLQEWPAVFQLIEKGLIDQDSIFVPGHSADLLSGSRSYGIPQLYKEPMLVASVVDDILVHNYRLFNISRNKEHVIKTMRERVLESLGPFTQFPDRASAYESWDVKERQSKFIVNSVRNYEYWNHGWWLPFWDSEFLEFWKSVPMAKKMEQSFYKKYIGLLTEECMERPLTKLKSVKYHINPLNEVACIVQKNEVLKKVITRVLDVYYKFSSYERNPMAFYGIVSKSRFIHHYSRNSNINSFLALDIIEDIAQSSHRAKDAMSTIR
jgi:asparagine synthase (glutamine-hydrolysing)